MELTAWLQSAHLGPFSEGPVGSFCLDTAPPTPPLGDDSIMQSGSTMSVGLLKAVSCSPFLMTMHSYLLPALTKAPEACVLRGYLSLHGFPGELYRLWARLNTFLLVCPIVWKAWFLCFLNRRMEVLSEQRATQLMQRLKALAALPGDLGSVPALLSSSCLELHHQGIQHLPLASTGTVCTRVTYIHAVKHSYTWKWK